MPMCLVGFAAETGPICGETSNLKNTPLLANSVHSNTPMTFSRPQRGSVFHRLIALIRKRDRHAYFCTEARSAVHLELPSNAQHTLPHTDQTKASLLAGLRLVKSAACVGDL